MNRPRRFDIDSLRKCVTGVFASHGYHGTSMSMLTDASGLGKQSLYNALGDKQAAYLQAIEFATERNAVQHFFNQVLAHCSGDDAAQNSCILTSGLMEGVEAEAIAAKLQAKWHELCMVLQASIERGQHDGSIRSDVPSSALCAVLVTLCAGLRVSARAPTDRQSLHTTTAWVLKLLDEGSPAP
jgi:TetR/AcrR family transcriptional regulator, transcriptional repressor for nem operon